MCAAAKTWDSQINTYLKSSTSELIYKTEIGSKKTNLWLLKGKGEGRRIKSLRSTDTHYI